MEKTRELAKKYLCKKLHKVTLSSELAEKLSNEIDKGTINYMIKNGHTEFSKDVYLSRLRVLLFNLTNKDNVKLLEQVLSKDVSIKQLCENMNHRELFPERYIEADQFLRDEFNKNYRKIDISELPDGALQCRKCKSWKTHYYEKQTRSADEPMTVFASCYNCEFMWRQ